MGRLRTLACFIALGAWGTGALGAYQDGSPGTAPASPSRPPSPVPPLEYLRAGSMLFNNGQYDLAAKYLKAASDYRDQLAPADQARLNEYLAAMNQVGPASAPAPAPADPSAQPASATSVPPGADAGSTKAQAAELVRLARGAIASGRVDEAAQLARQADALNAPFAANEDSPARLMAEIQTMGRGYPIEAKSTARWLLKAAREDIAKGDHAAARAKVDQARGMDIRWGLFDDTPDKVQKELDAAAPATAIAAPGEAEAPPAGRRERKEAAKAKLREARTALENAQYDRAEALATAVESWGVNFSVFEDSPEKIVAATKALRRRDGIRNQPAGEQGSQATYDLLVSESRRMLGLGDTAAAEDKARKALAMNVVPPVTSDRAESVLADIEAAKARADRVDPAVATVSAVQEDPAAIVEPAYAKLEREADALLSEGQHDAAIAKFSEAERLRAQSMGDPLAIPAQNLAPAADGLPALENLGEAPVPVAEAPAFNPQLTLPEPGGAPPSDIDPALKGIEQARALFGSGNYAAAREAAGQARQAGANPGEVDELISQIALAEQAASLKLYDAALAAVREQDFGRARALLNEVAALGDALDESMAQRVQDLLLKLPKDGQGAPAPLDAQMDAQALKAQQMNAEVGTKVAEARRLLETDPEKAIAVLKTTLEAVKAAGLSEPVTKTMSRRLEVALELAQKDKVAFEAKMKEKGAREEIERTKLRILEADTAKQKQVKEMMERALQFDADGDYAQAEMLAKRVTAIDPNNVSATALATTARTKRYYERDIRNRDAKNDGTVAMLQSVDEASIVTEDIIQRGISMPKNFAELTQDRGKYAAGENYKSPLVLEVERKLREPVTLNMEDSTLGEAVDFIRNYTGLSVILDGKALQEEAITKDAPVSFSCNQLPLKTALKFILERHGLTYRSEEGALVITTPQSRGRTIVRTYQVLDLLMTPKSPQVELGQYAQSNPSIAGLPGPDGTIMPASATGMAPNGNSAPVVNTGGPSVTYSDRETDFKPLIQLITTTIAPGTWEVVDPATGTGVPMAGVGLSGGFGGSAGGLAGGDEPPIGSITPFLLNISLIIRHTAEVHDDIVDLLRQLRRLQDLQVSVEVRFITVNDDFFEAIGVDFDFAIQSDIYGKGSSFVSENPAATPVAPGPGGGGGGGGGGTFTPPFLVNPNRWYSLGNRQPVVAGVGSNGGPDYTQRATGDLNIPFLQDSVTPALGLLNIVPGAGANFGLAFLSDLEVYLFLTALQGSTRSNVVQAPKVTTFNGASATILDVTTRNLVTSLTPIVNAGAVAFQPTISTIPDGVTLNVTPVVTADRRYVRLSLAPFFTVVQGVDTFTFGAGAVGGGGLGGGAANLASTVQLPIISTTAVLTTVTVPDGGTVLLGGVKRLTEQRLEYGTPILSKTPLVNRLFRNIGIGRTTDSVMLMVTPRIIILEEEEEKLGIPAVPTPGI